MDLQIACDLAYELMEQNGLLDGGWSFEWDNAKTRFGACHYQERKITLSRACVDLNVEEKVHDTILHEIAHALVWDERGHRGHGRVWQHVALQIGCSATRCSDGVAEEGKWLLTCPRCGRYHRRHRKSKSVTACRSCCDHYNYGKFDSRYIFKWEYLP